MVNVLVADDSALMREILKDLLDKETDIKVVGEAENGFDAIRKTLSLRPDVIVMDIQMPLMDGLTAIQKIMAEKPTPIIVLSAFTEKNRALAIACLVHGAVDFVNKPGGTISTELAIVKNELARKIRVAARAKVSAIKSAAAVIQVKPETEELPESGKVVVIVSSTGGPAALDAIVPRLPQSLGAGIIIVQHMPPGFTKSFSERLDKGAAIRVIEARSGDAVRDGLALMAPGGFHLQLTPKKRVLLTKGKPFYGLRPNADFTLESIAREFGKNTIGVELTGMGTDGAGGMALIKSKGGKVIAQDEKTSVIYGMPKEVAEAGDADFVLPLEKIAGKIVELVGL